MLHSVAASGRGGRGVRGALTCMTPVQLFVCDSETRLDIEFTIKKLIKTKCKTPHPQPLSPSTGRGEQDQKMWVKMRATPWVRWSRSSRALKGRDHVSDSDERLGILDSWGLVPMWRGGSLALYFASKGRALPP